MASIELLAGAAALARPGDGDVDGHLGAADSGGIGVVDSKLH